MRWVPFVLSLGVMGCVPSHGDPTGDDPRVSVDIVPATPVTTDDLVALLTPPDASVRFEWYVDDDISAATNDTTPFSMTRKGHAWRVDILDPATGAVIDSDTVMIGNSPPTATLTMEPRAPLATDDLLVTATGSDPDGDGVQFTYRWFVNDIETDITTPTVPSENTQSAEKWTVEVIPSDGDLEGEPVIAEIIVDNLAPTIDDVQIEPILFSHGDTIHAVASGSDPDGQPVSFTYQWMLNGEPIAGATESSLPGTQFFRGDEVSVQVTATDGYASSLPEESLRYTVQNAPPSGGKAEISSSYPSFKHGQSVTCKTQDFIDVDGDEITLSYTWWADGRVVDGNQRTWTISATRGQEVLCQVTPRDDRDPGSPILSPSITIANTAPERPEYTVEPAVASRAEPLTVKVSATEDADGDAVSVKVEWAVNGTAITPASPLSLPPSAFKKGDAVSITVYADDGFDTSLSSTSTKYIQNAPPTAPRISIPEGPYVVRGADSLTCTIDAASTDADGDAISYAFKWEYSVWGSSWTDVTSSASTLKYSKDYMPKSRVDSGYYRCIVSASDGTASTSTTSSAVESI